MIIGKTKTCDMMWIAFLETCVIRKPVTLIGCGNGGFIGFLKSVVLESQSLLLGVVTVNCFSLKLKSESRD